MTCSQGVTYQYRRLRVTLVVIDTGNDLSPIPELENNTHLIWRQKCLKYETKWRYSLKKFYLEIELSNTVKPVCNDHLYYKIYYLWSIQ